MEKTKHYGLSQWAMEDRILMDDFNADNATIDAALAAKGNCCMETGSYVGTGAEGAENPVSLVFGFKPVMVVLDCRLHTDGSMPQKLFLFQGYGYADSPYSSADLRVNWEGNSVSWYHPEEAGTPGLYQLNEAGNTYHYFAIGMAE